MIKFAVTRPKERLQAISHGISMLKWNVDPYLGHYGMKVDPNMTIVSTFALLYLYQTNISQTQARLLQPPEVQYAGKKANPGTSGRWDLRGMKFLAANSEPLKSWGVCIIGKCVDKPTVQNFVNVFVQTYTGHGGNVANRNPIIYEAPGGEELSLSVTNARTQAGNQGKSPY
jgi:eukaryotic translation initiation factor 2C